MLADGVDEEVNSEANDDEGSPEDPARLNHARAANAGGVGCAQAAEHHDGVLADGDVLAQVNSSEEVDQIVADGGFVVSGYVAEEIDYIVIGLTGDVNTSEEDDDISIDCASDVDIAEEADRVMNSLLGADVDVAAELNSVF